METKWLGESNKKIGARGDNIDIMVEQILAQNGHSVGLHRPNSVYVLSEYVLQIELMSATCS